MNLGGIAGGGVTVSGVCILSQNIINQKIYLVLWFWYIFILIIGALQIIFEVIIISVPEFRNYLITWQLGKSAIKDVRNFLVMKCNIGDWFLLYQISKNMDKNVFSLLLERIVQPVNDSHKLQTKAHEDVEKTAKLRVNQSEQPTPPQQRKRPETIRHMISGFD